MPRFFSALIKAIFVKGCDSGSLKKLSLVGFVGCSWEHHGQGECRGLKKRRRQKLKEGKEENLGVYRRETLQ